MPCFTKGEQSGTHDCSSHPYQIIEQHSYPIFAPDWGADEELLLLEGAETYGLGSWADIAEHIGGGRDKDEVKQHYIDTYINSPNFPLPELCDPNNNTGLDKISREEMQARKKRRIEAKKAAVKEMSVKGKPSASVPACHEVTGYMPGRMEFDVEFDNEAEGTVAAMMFEPGDGRNPETDELDPETELKLTVMDIYNSRLNARVQRKRVVFEHGLLEYRKITAQEKKRSKEERDLLNKTKPFARMMNKRDYDEFSEGVLQEFQLRQAIKILQEWRRAGVTSMEAGVKYEMDKASRNAIVKAQFGAQDRLSQRTTKANAAAEPPIQPHLAHLLAPQPPNLTTAVVVQEKKEPTPFNLPYAPGHSTSSIMDKHDKHSTPARESSISGPLHPISTNPQVIIPIKPRPKPDLSSILSGITYPPLPLTPENSSDLHLLSEEEVKLCSVLRIKPKPYIAIKEMMMKEALRQGGVLKKKTARELCRIDVNKTSRLHDFFVSSGWIGKA